MGNGREWGWEWAAECFPSRVPVTAGSECGSREYRRGQWTLLAARLPPPSLVRERLAPRVGERPALRRAAVRQQRASGGGAKPYPRCGETPRRPRSQPAAQAKRGLTQFPFPFPFPFPCPFPPISHFPFPVFLSIPLPKFRRWLHAQPRSLSSPARAAASVERPPRRSRKRPSGGRGGCNELAGG